MNTMIQHSRQKPTLEDFVTSKVAVFSVDNLLERELTSLPNGLEIYSTQNLHALNSFDHNSLPQIYVIDLYGVFAEDYPTLVNLVSSLKTKNPEGKVLVLATEKQTIAENYNPIRAADRKNIIDEVLIRPNGSSRSGYEDRVKRFLNTRVADYLDKKLSKPPLVKIGGSMYDFIPAGKAEVWRGLVEEMAGLFPIYPMIASVGGGPKQDVNKNYKSQLSMGSSEFEYFSQRALEDQARLLMGYLQSIGANAIYANPVGLGLIDAKSDILRTKLHIVALSGSNEILPSQSDTHTLAIADGLKLNKVIFAKNTEGIFLWDPNVQYNPEQIQKLNDKLRDTGSELQKFVGAENRFFPYVNASEILEGRISRWGFDNDGQISDNHVIERSALEYFLNNTKNVQRIQVINGTKRGTLESALKGENVGSYILKA